MPEAQEWTHDKPVNWGEGPWLDEPDKVQWVDEDTDLDCLIVRNPMGALCGYVGVPKSHPWFGLDYNTKTCGDACDEGDEYWCSHRVDSIVSIHGGLTFSDSCQEDAEEGHGVCHIPLPGRTDEIWWFGFDCAHASDLVPRMVELDKEYGFDRSVFTQRYKDIEWVKAEVTRLARQLVDI